jgi:glucose-fructose oxidoreductase
MKTPPACAPVSRRRFLSQVSTAAAVALMPKWSLAIDGPLPDRKLGIAFVGLGSYSTEHLAPSLRLTKHWAVKGVVTGSRAKGEKWARQYGFPERNIFGYETMAGLADRPDIDVVYVVTPNGLHAEHCIAAAKAGKHVICEKPMANTVAQCDAIIAACKAAGVRLMVGYRLHYEPHHAEFARLARDKVYGSYMRMNGANGFEMGPPDGSSNNWRVNKKLAGGGPLMDMGVYVIQAACMAKVEASPATVTAKFGRVTQPELFSEVEESIKWTMKFADGAEAKCRASYAEAVSHFRAESDSGWAELGEPAFYYDPTVLRTSRGVLHFPTVNNQAAQMDRMAAELLTGRASIVPGEMGRRDVAIAEAIYAAAKSGQSVDVTA